MWPCVGVITSQHVFFRGVQLSLSVKRDVPTIQSRPAACRVAQDLVVLILNNTFTSIGQEVNRGALEHMERAFFLLLLFDI